MHSATRFWVFGFCILTFLRDAMQDLESTLSYQRESTKCPRRGRPGTLLVKKKVSNIHELCHCTTRRLLAVGFCEHRGGVRFVFTKAHACLLNTTLSPCSYQHSSQPERHAHAHDLPALMQTAYNRTKTCPSSQEVLAHGLLRWHPPRALRRRLKDSIPPPRGCQVP